MARKRVLGEDGVKELIYKVKDTMGPITHTRWDSYTKKLTLRHRHQSDSEKLVIDMKEQMLELCYPVGTIYQSYENTSPETFLGGTWTKLTSGDIVMAAGSTYTAGSTGGNSNNRYFSLSNLPKEDISNSSTTSHYHGIYSEYGTCTVNCAPSANTYMQVAGSGSGTRVSKSRIDSANSPHNHTWNLNGNQTQTTYNTTPPYIRVHMWERTA